MKVIRPKKTGEFPKLDDGVHDVALGNLTQWRIALSGTDGESGALYVGIVGKKSHEFSPGTGSPGYVAEKLGIMIGDAQNMSDFIASQFGEFDPEAMGVSAGHFYHEDLIANGSPS